jgi:hypothetical protein
MVLLADDDLIGRLDLVELLLEAVGGGPTEVVVLVQEVELRVLLRRELGEVERELGRVHVGVEAAAEGGREELLAGHLRGLGAGGEEDLLLLVRHLGHRLGDVRPGIHGQQVHLLAQEQVVGASRGDIGLELAVRRHDLDLPAQHAAGGVDALGSEAEPGQIRLADVRHRAAGGLEHSDLDRTRLGPSRARDDERPHGRRPRGDGEELSAIHFASHD